MSATNRVSRSQLNTADEVRGGREGRVRRRERAIVMGGSLAGLTAARVLSDHYREVIVVERDASGQWASNGAGCRRAGMRMASFPAASAPWKTSYPA
jgi:heterodisulfide reductase subunit A-like polyferredoxin